MLDEIAAIPGLKGVMLTFDDFIIGMEQFGEHIQPRMKSRAKAGPRPRRSDRSAERRRNLASCCA